MQEIAGESNMQRYEKLLRNLYGADLFYGKIDLKVNYSFSCYFIVQHTNEEEFIREQLLQLILTGCQKFIFYGGKADAWVLNLEEAASILRSDHLTVPYSASIIDTIEAFARELHREVSFRSLVPHDVYLLYDNERLYRKVLGTLDINYAVS